MRTVKGEVISSKTISLKEAAGTLSRFAASETGAKPEVAAFLKRSVAAFKDLVHAHRQIRLMKKEMNVNRKKVEALGSEKKVEEGRDLVLGSLNVWGKERREFDALEVMKKKKKEKKRSFFEGEMEDNSKKVGAFGSEKKVEEGRDLVLESLNVGGKKRKDFDALEGEVKGEMKKRRRIVEDDSRLIKKEEKKKSFFEGEMEDGSLKVEALGSEKKVEERRDLGLESLNVGGKKRKDFDAREGEVQVEMKKERRSIEDDSRLIKKKKKKEKKKSFFEGETEDGSQKVEALGYEKKDEERKDLVLESLNIERKKRRHFDAEEGEVKMHEGKMKGRRVIEEKMEAFDYEKKSEKRRDFVSENLIIERKKRRDSDVEGGEVNGEMKKHDGKKKKRRRVIE